MPKGKKPKYIKLGKEKVDRNSMFGKLIEKSAEIKKVPVEKYVKGSLKNLQELGKDFTLSVNSVAIDSVSDYIESAKTVFFDGERVSKTTAVFKIEQIRNKIARIDSSIMQILVTFDMDMQNKLFFTTPDFSNEDEGIEDIESNLEDSGYKIIISDKNKNAKKKFKRNYSKKPKRKK